MSRRLLMHGAAFAAFWPWADAGIVPGFFGGLTWADVEDAKLFYGDTAGVRTWVLA